MVVQSVLLFIFIVIIIIYVIYKDFEKVLQNQIITRISTEPLFQKKINIWDGVFILINLISFHYS